MTSNTILSLFDYSGNWSEPYRLAGFNVIQIDIKLGIDILEFDYTQIDSVYGILAAVPCTDFAVSGARWWKEKDKTGATKYSLKLLDRTLDIIDYFNPQFWAIENPVGRIAKFRPSIGKPWYFDPCDFGDPYTKKTGLYGEFMPPLPLFIGGDWSVYPSEGSKMHKLPPSENRQELRSETPKGFAKAFYLANP